MVFTHIYREVVNSNPIQRLLCLKTVKRKSDYCQRFKLHIICHNFQLRSVISMWVFEHKCINIVFMYLTNNDFCEKIKIIFKKMINSIWRLKGFYDFVSSLWIV